MSDHPWIDGYNEAIRLIGTLLESEARYWWERDAPPTPIPGAQAVAQRMDVMAEVVRNMKSGAAE